ncbi:DPBB-1 domain-containing protein [Mycena kentingensis (nom. inval.)]|nr:DPBB-1 domain-containing protein [Mycena kentingensis (nom. inval.)]
MLFRSAPALLALSLLVLTEASTHGQSAHLAHLRRSRPLNPRGEQPLPVSKRSVKRRSCRKKSSSSLSATKATSTIVGPVANVAHDPSTTSKKAAATTKASSPDTSSDSDSGSSNEAVAAGNFKPTKPADWPTATQAGGAQPTSTFASSHDPYLKELSKALNNDANDMFTRVYEGGDMTYYGQGLGACGDVYTDDSFTAAVSHEVFDNWPGADPNAQNRNPICGPFVPGRTAIAQTGLFVTAVKSSISGHAMIGGDGLINCVGTADVQCHIPLTATVTHGDKSIQVRVVDRCHDCELNDIDLTPAAFAALADPALGRTTVKWQFNKW